MAAQQGHQEMTKEQIISTNRGTAAKVHGPTCWPHGHMSPELPSASKDHSPAQENPWSPVGVTNYSCLKPRCRTLKDSGRPRQRHIRACADISMTTSEGLEV